MPAVRSTPPSSDDTIEIKRGLLLLACAAPILTAAASMSIARFLVCSTSTN